MISKLVQFVNYSQEEFAWNLFEKKFETVWKSFGKKILEKKIESAWKSSLRNSLKPNLKPKKMSIEKSTKCLLIVSLVMLFVIVVQITPTMAQITFSKDWRAGGKRFSIPANFDDEINSCEQLERYSLNKVRDLIRVRLYFLLKSQIVIFFFLNWISEGNNFHTSMWKQS